MPGNLDADVCASLAVATRNSKALENGLEELRIAVADRKWELVQPIREKMIAAIEGYVDNFVAAGRRVDFERNG